MSSEKIDFKEVAKKLAVAIINEHIEYLVGTESDGYNCRYCRGNSLEEDDIVHDLDCEYLLAKKVLSIS